MKKLIVFFMAVGCTHLPSSPEELRTSNSPSISTQEAILPNTSYEQMFQRMREYADQCLKVSRTITCKKPCTPTVVAFTPTLLTEKNKITLLLQKKGGSGSMERPPAKGFYIMMAEVLRNGGTLQLMIRGVEGFQNSPTTQATMDWLAGKKKICPKI
jgi:hypothetical protein